jgi:Tyrosine phosphatase family
MAAAIDLAALLDVPILDPLEESQVAQIFATDPFLPIPQALNLRRISSPTLRPDIVYRSGALTQIPPSALTKLRSEYNITTIFDLRHRREREQHPSPEIQGIETIWIPSSGDGPVGIGGVQTSPKQVLEDLNPVNFVTNDGVDGYVRLYANLLGAHKDPYRAVFEKLEEPQGGVLFHCSGALCILFSQIALHIFFYWFCLCSQGSALVFSRPWNLN